MKLKNKDEYIEELNHYRKRRVPLVAIQSSLDQADTVRTLSSRVIGNDALCFEWNFSEGMVLAPHPENSTAVNLSKDYLKQQKSDSYLLESLESLQAFESIMGKVNQPCVLFVKLSDKILSQYNDSLWSLVQCLNNMRDKLKLSSSTVYLLSGSVFNLPRELSENTIVISEPLPQKEERIPLITKSLSIFKDKMKGEGVELPEATEEKVDTIADELLGSSKFSAEQALYLSFKKSGLDMEVLRDKKLQMINNTRGLTVLKGTGLGFDAIGGHQNLKDYLLALRDGGRLRTHTVVRVEEIDKIFNNKTADTSGVGEEFLGRLLTVLQETKSEGLLTQGIYGCGKSAIVSALTEELGAIGIELDLSIMKQGIVGSSQENLENALQVIQNIAGDTTILWVASCNREEALPPELKSRFGLGTFFFCFPSDEEKKVIWDIYKKRFNITEQGNGGIMDYRWTGREIENTCRLSYLMRCSLLEASAYTTPIHKSANTEIEKLMSNADNRFLSTAVKGLFNRDDWVRMSEESKGDNTRSLDI